MNKKKVLIIDDSPFMTQMFSLRLHEEGFECLIAGSGEDGLRIAANEKPVAILLDIAMPGMTGWDVLKSLKNSDLTKDIPVLILTNSKGNEEDRERAQKLGAVEFLMKIELKVDDIMKIVDKYA
jgi:DNA-binding response OmpR family regulator